MSINVTVVGSTGINATIGSSDGVQVAIGTTFVGNGGVPALQIAAGANITVTTTSGVFTIVGRDVPVQSVNGKTGSVSLTASDLTAALAVHTHSTTDVVGFTAAASAAAPVQQVAGRTGVISLVAGDVSGLAPVATSGSYTSLSDIPTSFTPASHTHQASEIANLTSVANVVSVNGKTGVAVLSSTDVSAASAVHSHVATDVTDLTSVANVVSVNGITGTPVIVGGSGVTVSTAGSSITIEASGGTGGGAGLSDATPQPLGTAAAGTSSLASRADHVHELPTISYTSLSNVPAAFAPDTSVANVVSVNGKTGVAVLSSTDVSAASAVHSHVAVDVTDLTSVANVVSVNGKTGVAVLSSTDVSAASAVHSHVAVDVTDLTSVANVVSVNGQTGVVTINAGDALPSQGGNATRLLTTDGTSASWATRYSVVDPVVVAGAGIVLSRDTAAGEITIGANGGIVGTTAALVETKSPSTSQNDYAIGSGDIIRLNPSANVTLTGIAGGEDGVVRVLYNVSTHVVTLAAGNTNSAETNRFTISSGNIELGDGDSASVWYDGTSQRWRVLTDEVTSQGGSGGGAGFSYLFG